LGHPVGLRDDNRITQESGFFYFCRELDMLLFNNNKIEVS